MLRITSIDKPHTAPLVMPDRFRMEVVYFMTPGDSPGAPRLETNEYWIRLKDSRIWAEDGVVSIVSPLDAQSVADIEVTEDQERWLDWLVANETEHIRIEAVS